MLLLLLLPHEQLQRVNLAVVLIEVLVELLLAEHAPQPSTVLLFKQPRILHRFTIGEALLLSLVLLLALLFLLLAEGYHLLLLLLLLLKE